MTEFLRSEAGIALLGVVVGAIFSLLLQILIFYREYLREMRSQRELMRTRILSLYWNVEEVREFIDRLADICEDSDNRKKKNNLPRISMAMGVIFTNVRPRVVSEEELYFILKNHKLVDLNALKSFLGSSMILYELANEYRRQREKMLDLLPGRASGDGLIIGEMSVEEARRVEPHLANLDMFANMIIENVPKCVADGKKSAQTLRFLLRKQLGLNITLRTD